VNPLEAIPRLFRLVAILSVLVSGPVVGAAATDPSAEIDSVRMAIEDLSARFGERYPKAGEFRTRLKALEARDPANAQSPANRKKSGKSKRALAAEIQAWHEQLTSLRRDVMLAHPLLAEFDGLMAVRRAISADGSQPRGAIRGSVLGLPQNWMGNCALPKTGYHDEIVAWPRIGGSTESAENRRTVFKPADPVFVGDVDLSSDATRILFSMPKPGETSGWHVWELELGKKTPRQLTPDEPDVDHYDACYLPDRRIVFTSTAGFQGVPCIGGHAAVANLYLMDADGTHIRQLTFDQDHNWCPTVLNDGRVMFTRWEYTDTPHFFTRQLMSMNPDGTAQMSLYGSNSYWPNSIFYARPIPGSPSKIIAIISGHHGIARMGELILFDTAKGRHEADGVVQRIPGHNKVVDPITTDGLVNRSRPRFVHPFPIDEHFFLVTCQPDAKSPFGIWLVDTFDNMIPIKQEPGYALLEPIPIKKSTPPPTITDRVDLKRNDADVFLANIYAGKGMDGVPRGTVKKLRLFEYHYAYRWTGGHSAVGIDGPWDVRRILGTVPVEADGSAHFTVPSLTPIAIQPLDANGRAVQVMRSWFTAQPGEQLSCVGCHEDATEMAPSRPPLAAAHAPTPIEPWRGPARGFSFKRDVQPVLDHHCLACHDGASGPDNAEPCLSTDRNKHDWKHDPVYHWRYYARFSPSYLKLMPYVYRPGSESDYHIPHPGEYLAENSELIQMLRKGHHGVVLDPESFDRLVTWIDLNVPDHGTWSEVRAIRDDYHEQRIAMRTRYANRPEDPEKIPDLPVAFKTPAKRLQTAAPAAPPAPDGWPIPAEAARNMRGKPVKIDVGPGISLELMPAPAGRFVMGAPGGSPDESPRIAEIKRPFHIGRFEVTNRQFACFDPDHDSGYQNLLGKDIRVRGVPLNAPDQPAVRVSWHQANAFCRWLSQKTGKRFRLPTEEEWEWACRAGNASPMNYGAIETDFSQHANLADHSFADIRHKGLPDWLPRIDEVDDHFTVTAPVGQFQPNAWGLHDMHGNAAEWTSSIYRPLSFLPKPKGKSPWRILRGGSYRDRPKRATSSFRYGYAPWVKPRDTGFRVVMECCPKSSRHRRKGRRRRRLPSPAA